MTDAQTHSQNPFGFLFGYATDPLELGPAMAFYGPDVFHAIMKYEAEERAFAAMRQATKADRIDDVAGQVIA